MAKIGLLTEPAWKSVLSVTGAGSPCSRTPKARAHSIRPSLITAMDTPGVW